MKPKRKTALKRKVKKKWEIGASYVTPIETIMIWNKIGTKQGIMIAKDKYLREYDVTKGKIEKNVLGNYRAWGKSKYFKTKPNALKYVKELMKK